LKSIKIMPMSFLYRHM